MCVVYFILLFFSKLEKVIVCLSVKELLGILLLDTVSLALKMSVLAYFFLDLLHVTEDSLKEQVMSNLDRPSDT